MCMDVYISCAYVHTQHLCVGTGRMRKVKTFIPLCTLLSCVGGMLMAEVTDREATPEDSI